MSATTRMSCALFMSQFARESLRFQELCESRGGRPRLPVSNSPYGLCGRTATLNGRVLLIV